MRRKTILFLLIFVFGSLSTLLLFSFKTHEAGGQAIIVAVSLLAFVLITTISKTILLKFAPFTGMTLVGALLLTLFWGKLSHGATRWLPIGPFHLQVSEFAKPVMLLLLTMLVAKIPLNDHKRILFFFILVGLFFIPVFLQPDLGSALVILVFACSLLFFAVQKLRLLLPWIMTFFFFSIFIYAFLLRPYQKDRVISFLHAQGSAHYNAEQAFITVGSGKIWGRGLGHGVQTQLKFLPEYHTDFFFASLCEELGLLGVSGVLILYLLLFWAMVWKQSKSNMPGMWFSYAFFGGIFFQTAIHMGMNMKLFPIAGIPLPLLSLGGSSFLSTAIGLAICAKLSEA